MALAFDVENDWNYKNRNQIAIDPVKSQVSPTEKLLHQKKFSKKVEKVLNSRLKIKSRVFKLNESVKVMFPKQRPKYGLIQSTDDSEFKTSVKIKFIGPYGKLSVVNKDYIG